MLWRVTILTIVLVAADAARAAMMFDEPARDPTRVIDPFAPAPAPLAVDRAVWITPSVSPAPRRIAPAPNARQVMMRLRALEASMNPSRKRWPFLNASVLPVRSLTRVFVIAVAGVFLTRPVRRRSVALG